MRLLLGELRDPAFRLGLIRDLASLAAVILFVTASVALASGLIGG